MDSFYRYYLADRIHPLDDEVLEQALESFEGVAFKFSADMIKDAAQRKSYERNIKRVKAAILEEVKSGKVSVKEAAAHCYEMRNKIMAEIRARTSVQGKAIVERRKPTPLALQEILDKNAMKEFGKKFDALDATQKTAIHYATIESAARSDAKYNTGNKRLQVAGKVLIIVTVAYAMYDVMTADDQTRAVIEQGFTIGGGVGGTALAGLALTPVCGPAAPICVIGVLLAGGIVCGVVGSIAAKKTVAYFDEEIDEFNQWMLE